MPGGQGAGGLAGMLMRGAISNGGSGRTIGDPAMTGQGVGQNSESVSDIYDVDRWKRADDLDSGYESTMVKTVRDAWERETREKKKHSLKSKILDRIRFGRRGESRRSMSKRERRMERRALGSQGRKDDYEKERRYEDADREHESLRNIEQNGNSPDRIRSVSSVRRPQGMQEGNTIITPGMRKALHHIPEVVRDCEDNRACDSSADNKGRPYYRIRENSPIGLMTRAGIDSFFSSNPLNSTLLAVDSLSMGPITLNQVRKQEVDVNLPGKFIFSEGNRFHSAGIESVLSAETMSGGNNHVAFDHTGESNPSSESISGVSNVSSIRNNNLITEHTGAQYMNALREHREQRKYDVRVRNH